MTPCDPDAEGGTRAIELASSQIHRPAAAIDSARYQVDLQVADLQSEDVGRSPAAKERPNAGEQFRDRKRLDQIIIGAAVETRDTVVDAVTSRQDQHRRLDATLAKGFENLETAAPRQHEIQQDQIEPLSIGAEEAVFAGGAIRTS